ncbi:hypothetical protein N781_14440 [Pontibacillus halophilus JSM 076056 = DSM 19796]|uniref:Uncharacterized protein n=1 Tax=Pontibacillus halophilus JSM 076056 = DSM 19796 TaxID=1385510 RepID=A0A0A5GHM1_9BACI|nr:hypothetical protein [Pontibacillus halophilus]KGX92766.1 hypothetical protein N781_14440 [Pontibacillus halophilus JSM 076056 = DSM 19796]
MQWLQRLKHNWLLTGSSLLLFFLLATWFLNAFLTNWVFETFLFFFFLCVILLAILFLGLSIRELFRKDTLTWKVVLPLVLLITFFILLVTNPLYPILKQASFQWKLDARTAIAEQVNQDELLVTDENVNGTWLALPDQFKWMNLSDEDVVHERNGYVLFYLSKGVMNHYSGYVYSRSGTAPPDGLFCKEDDFIETTNHRHWYFIQCN